MKVIVFEGGEGVGKTTQIKKTALWLQQRGFSVHVTREPGGTPIAEKIRTLFKDSSPNQDAFLPLTELFLVMAARHQHLTYLNQCGADIVLCDRFLDSSYVYQCFVGGLGKEVVDNLGKLVVGEWTPTLTLVLTGHVRQAFARTRLRNEHDRNDEKELTFHSKIHTGFETLVRDKWPYPTGIIPQRELITIDAGIESTFDLIKHHILKHL